MISPLYFVYIILGIILIYIILIFNRLILLRNGVKTTFSQIDVLIKKRVDLLTRLVSVVKGYSNHEKKVFEDVTSLRSDIDMENTFTKSKKAFKSIVAVAENYPDIKASENYKVLFKENVSVENEIMRMRIVYNNVVEKYNNKIQFFPSNMIARLFSFKEEKYLEFK